MIHSPLPDVDVAVDHDAEPVDLNRVLAEFLLSYVRSAQAMASDEAGHGERDAKEVAG